MPVQLEVAILAADAGGAAPARRQQAGTVFRRGVGVGKAIVDRIKLDTLLKGEDHLRSLGPEYLPRIGIFVLMCAVAAITRNPRFHALFVFAALVYEISFFGRYYATLN